MEITEKLARWADKQGWFRIKDTVYLLPDGSRFVFCLMANSVLWEKRI